VGFCQASVAQQPACVNCVNSVRVSSSVNTELRSPPGEVSAAKSASQGLEAAKGTKARNGRRRLAVRPGTPLAVALAHPRCCRASPVRLGLFHSRPPVEGPPPPSLPF
jgi:hypothetical protein